jgi:hypothetical protein
VQYDNAATLAVLDIPQIGGQSCKNPWRGSVSSRARANQRSMAHASLRAMPVWWIGAEAPLAVCVVKAYSNVTVHRTKEDFTTAMMATKMPAAIRPYSREWHVCLHAVVK